MKHINSPFWILYSILAPLLVLLAIFGDSLYTIFTELTQPGQHAWISLFALMGTYLTGISLYGLHCLRKDRNIPWQSGLGVLLIHAILLFLFVYFADTLVPRTIPQWILSSGDLCRYAFTFGMPGAVWGLLALVDAQARKEFFKGNIKLRPLPLVLLFGVPLSLYVVFTIGMPLLGQASFPMIEILLPVGLVLGVLGFLFGLVSVLYHLVTRKTLSSRVTFWLFKFPALLGFPILGLFINGKMGGVFGDFSSPLFYILTGASGILFLIPLTGSGIQAQTIFWLRSLSITFLGFFFLLFLPFLPLSVFAVIFIGTGFLMLAPLIAMMFAGQRLYLDFIAIKDQYSTIRASLLLFSGMVVLPLILTLNNLQDRRIFQGMLDHVFDSPDHSIELAAGDLGSIVKGLQSLSAMQNNRGWFSGGSSYTPYLTPYYNWLVFDNMNLPTEKLRVLNEIFRNLPGEESPNRPRPWTGGGKVSIAQSSVQWKTANESRIQLILKNELSSQQEFRSRIQLPADAFISGYSLTINGIDKEGLLVERKAATWVYQQILNENRDPGLLRYLPGSPDLELRIFPFSGNQIRYSGLSVLHNGPIQIQLDSTTIQIDGDSAARTLEFPGLGAVIPSSRIDQLPRALLPRRFHLILDASENAKAGQLLRVAQVDTFLARNPGTPSFLAMNFRGKQLSEKTWKQEYLDFPKEGGLFLERAIRNSLVNAYKISRDTLPRLVLFSDRKVFPVLKNDLAKFAITQGGDACIFVMNSRGELWQKRLNGDSLQRIEKLPDLDSSAIFTNQENLRFALPLHQGSVLLPFVPPSLASQAQATNAPAWDAAARLALLDLQDAIFPRKQWKNLVQQSFAQHVLMPSTAFIVVENPAQEKALLQKQKDVLKANANLEIDAQESQMSEPEFWILLAVAVASLLWQGRSRLTGKSVTSG